MERFRQWLRTRIGYRSALYRFGSALLNECAVALRAGPGVAMRIWRLRLSPPGVQRAIKFPNIAHPFIVRSRSDDLGTAINNFVRLEYGQFPASFEPRTIVDAGAYIGDTSAYFLSRYPLAQVIALEPATASFQIASRNLHPYGARVVLKKAALGATRGTVFISGNETAAGISTSGEAVPMLTVPDLIAEFPDRCIDLLKLDIEGAEREVLCSGAGAWLARVRRIVVETHSNDIERAVLLSLREQGWRCVRFRNLWYCEPTPSVHSAVAA
jgi:FkbM family methyltransferase